MFEEYVNRRQAIKRIAGLASAPIAFTWFGGMLPSLATAATTSSAFSDTDIQTIQVMGDSIIPVDHEPGAINIDIGVLITNTISQQKSSDIEQFKLGIDSVNYLAMEIYQRPLYELMTDERDHLLGVVSTHPVLSAFWDTVRSLTVLYFYTLPIGYKQVGLPGPNIETQQFKDADSRGCAV